MTETTDFILQILNLNKTYFMGKISLQVLFDINLNIKQGEFLSIMGPSGCGKSTLLNLIGCLDRPTSGSIYFKKVNVALFDDRQQAKVRNKEIGFVFQTFNLLPRITAQENVEIPLIYSGINRKERKMKSLKALESMGIAHRAKHNPNELSGGERQKVAIARAIVNNPSIILADEPTGNLDSKSGLEVMRIFEDLNKKGVTIIMVTHDQNIAMWGTRLVKLFDGRIIEDTQIKK